ncbi:MAG: nucleoside phosphorylase [Clostridiales bacterium]|nr:nucleoside phosphorylase [Clostridiales bacterium]
MPQLQPHIRLDSSHGAVCALLPGDPARLDRIRPFLESPEELAYNREYRSLVGSYQGIRVLAVSTGIGAASAGIAVEELNNLGVKNMIRIGSCGALQPQVKIGDLILVSGAVRDDGASKTYIDPVFPAVPDSELLFASVSAAKKRNYRFHTGIARSHDSFYTDREEEIDAYWSRRGVLGSDMETAALYTIGHLRGIRAMSILNNVVAFETDTLDAIGSYVDGESAAMRGEEREILTALDAFAAVLQLV